MAKKPLTPLTRMGSKWQQRCETILVKGIGQVVVKVPPPRNHAARDRSSFMFEDSTAPTISASMIPVIFNANPRLPTGTPIHNSAKTS